MSRKKIMTLAAIALLLVLIAAKELIKTDSVPNLEKIEGQIDKIEIDRDGSTLVIEYSADKWLIGPKQYPAAKAQVEKIAAALTDLRLYEKISSGKNYEKYELEDKALKIRAYMKGAVVRELTVGKQSSTSSQAYVLLKDDPAVYLAGNFSVRDLRKPVEDLRDKEILKVSEDAMTKLSVAYEGSVYSLVKAERADPEDANKKIGVWQFEGQNTDANQDLVKAMLAKVDPLIADSFVEAYTETAPPLAELTLSAYGKELVLRIFEKMDDTAYVAKCSESPYYFKLAAFKVDPLLKKRDELK